MQQSDSTRDLQFGIIHTFDESGASDSYLLESPSGAHIKLSNRSRIVLEMRWAGETFESISNRLGELRLANATPDEVRNFFSAIDQQIRRADASAIRATPMFSIRFPLIPKASVEKIVRPFEALYQPIVSIALVSAIVVATIIGAFAIPIHQHVHPTLIAVAIGYSLYFLSLVIHEIGHASAASKYGGNPAAIGFTMYLTFPALYSDVTNAWKLKRWQRVVVDLGGTYFQLIVACVYLLLFVVTHFDAYRLAIFAIIGTSLFNLNPLFKFDGYWIVSDSLGIANLSRQPLRLLRIAFAALFKRVSQESLPWSRWTIVSLGVYSILAITAWAYFLERLIIALANNAGHTALTIRRLWLHGDLITKDDIVSAGWNIVLILISALALFNIVRSSSVLFSTPPPTQKQRSTS